MLNKLSGLFCIGIVLSGICRAATPMPDGTSLSFSLAKGGVRAAVSSGPEMRQVTMDGLLERTLSGATEVLVVGQRGFPREGHDYIILAIAKPSTEHNGLGYCGAGTEEKLLLIEWQRVQRSLRLSDVLEVQSCLKTFELASDQGHDLKSLLGGFVDPAELTLTWLNHPVYGDVPKSISVKDGRFHVR